MKKTFLTIMTCATLYSCMGCSDSNAPEVEPTPSPSPEEGNYTASDMVVYEVNPRIFGIENAFKAVEANLDHIKSLGTTVLWLMPVNDPGVKNSVQSPYCIRDYKGLNPQYGILADLKSLVNAAHAKGMKVILDWVANHTSWDHIWTVEHPEWFTQKNGNFTPPAEFPEWGDVIDLNFDSQEMQDAMIEAMEYWVKETGIDGYRCDYAEGVPVSFWKKATDALRALDEDVILLAEAGKAEVLTEGGFDMLYAWGFQDKLEQLYAGKATVEDLFNTYKEEKVGMPEGSIRMRYSTNHDQARDDSPLDCFNGERGAMSAFVIATMLDGIPLVYSSQEAAYPEALNFFNYEVVDVKANAVYCKEMTNVISAYKNTKDVRGGELKLYSTGNVVSFYRNAGEHGMLVMVNPTNEAVQVKMPMEQAGKTMKDMMTGESVKLPSAVTMQPYQYVIYKK